MPHVDGMSLVPGYRRSGESPFAAPVAAITSVVVSWFEHARKSWEIRKRGEDYARATDLPDLERMERDWDRRDGGGMRTW